jgi:hypothetical protein
MLVTDGYVESGCCVRQSELFLLIREFLKSRYPTQKCDRCGSNMQFLNGEFWLHRTVLRWNMALPFCPACDVALEVYSRRINGVEVKAKATGSKRV